MCEVRWALTTDVGAFFLWGNGEGGGEMGLWIFLSWNCIFDWKYFPKSVNFTFSLPFYKVKTVVKLHFSRKYDGSARKQLKNNFRVEFVRSQYNLTRWGISPHSIFRNGVNGSFAPIGWPRKGGRNSDSTTQAKESPACFLSGEQRPTTGVISGLPRWRGLKRGK